MTGNAPSTWFPMAFTSAGAKEMGCLIPRGDARAVADALRPLRKTGPDMAGTRAFARGFMRELLGKGLEGTLL